MDRGINILAIDTSCDETSVAVTQGTRILSNVIWSQASAHAEFGGVMPSLAQRMHNERINWVVERAITISQIPNSKINAIAVTAGPGLAIALEVGIRKAKELAGEWRVPLIEVNHIEGHLLSPLADLRSTRSQAPITKQIQYSKIQKVEFPALGLAVSGGHTELVYIKEIGKYKIIAATEDDALGEALDKAARMLGLGYPGGAFLEKLAREGNLKHYPLPLPMAGREDQNKFSYSGIKTAMFRLINSQSLSKQDICDLAASFQDIAFKHLIRVMRKSVENNNLIVKDLLVGGGVAANIELRKRLRLLAKELGMTVHFPPNRRLCGDNAGMIGVAAGLRYKTQLPSTKNQTSNVDRKPRWKVEEK